MAVPQVMVHGNLISEPIDSYKKAYFCDEVFNELEAMRYIFSFTLFFNRLRNYLFCF